MASATLPTVQYLLQNINADGLFILKDATKGSEAEQFAGKNFPITTVDGLEFCKVHTFGDPVSRPCSLFLYQSDIINSELLDSSSLLLTGLVLGCTPTCSLSQAACMASSREYRRTRVL